MKRIALWAAVAFFFAQSDSWAKQEIEDSGDFAEIPVTRASPEGGFIAGSPGAIAPADERVLIFTIGLEGPARAQPFRLDLGFDPAVLGSPQVLPHGSVSVRTRINRWGELSFVANEDALPKREAEPLRAWPQKVESLLCRDIDQARSVARVRFTILDIIRVGDRGLPSLAWSLSMRERSDQTRPCVVSAWYQGFTERAIPRRPTAREVSVDE